MKELTEVTKRMEARPSEGPLWGPSIRSELMVCESWPMVMSLSCVWVPVHVCQTEAVLGLFLHKLYMSVSEAWHFGHWCRLSRLLHLTLGRPCHLQRWL
jgi:hypothetical protein